MEDIDSKSLLELFQNAITQEIDRDAILRNYYEKRYAEFSAAKVLLDNKIALVAKELAKLGVKTVISINGDESLPLKVETPTNQSRPNKTEGIRSISYFGTYAPDGTWANKVEYILRKAGVPLKTDEIAEEIIEIEALSTDYQNKRKIVTKVASVFSPDRGRKVPRFKQVASSKHDLINQ